MLCICVIWAIMTCGQYIEHMFNRYNYNIMYWFAFYIFTIPIRFYVLFLLYRRKRVEQFKKKKKKSQWPTLRR